MPHIFDYLDYREFLQAWLDFKQQSNPKYSLRLLAKQLECSPSFLTRVFQGKKNMSPKLVLKIGNIIKLSKTGGEYLELLLQLQKADSQIEKKHVLDKISRLRKPQIKTIQSWEYQYYDKWYIAAIRELLGIYKFKGDYSDLAKQLDPPIRDYEAKKAIKVLEELEFIRKNEGGYYQQTATALTSGEGWRSVAIANYQIENIDLAKKAFDKYSEELRNFSSLTLSISKETYDVMAEKLRSLRTEFLEMEKNDRRAERVYQMNFQIFPVSQNQRGEGNA